MHRTQLRAVGAGTLVSVLAAAILFFGPRSAAAQAELTSGGMDLHLFRPAVDSKGIITVNGTDILGDGDYSFGLILDAGFGLMPFAGFVNDETDLPSDAQREEHLVDVMGVGTLHFNYGFDNRFAFGAQVPIAVVSGEDVTVPGFYNEGGGGLSYEGLGDVTLHAKVRLTRVERTPIGLAALLHVELPTGATDQFAGDGFTLWPVLAAEVRPLRPIRFAVNIGYRASFAENAENFPLDGRANPSTTAPGANVAVLDPSAGTPLDYGHQITFGAGLSFRIAEMADLAVESYGSQLVGSIGDEGSLSMEAVGALKIFVERNSYFFLGAGAGLPNGGFRAADMRGFLGFIFEPSIGDRDGDGYKDDNDECPDDPEDFDDFEDEDGCPDPDNDRDGILDLDDDCPMIPEDLDGDADEDGCPEGGEGDRDGDGIMDSVDECPDDPEDLDGFQDEDGCPDPDNDQDGILDRDDLCPMDPEDRDDFEDEDGCPDPDNDNDHILDVDDSCPNEPETYNGKDDEDGCPDTGITMIDDDSIIILQKINFETDSAVIMQRSYPVVDAVAATMNGNPQIRLVEVQGHADERSSDEYNIRLTRDRASSVVEALVQRGVSRERLRSAGYGERCPLDGGHNQSAWEQNRRVEFKIIQTDDGPTGVRVACPAGRELVPR